jgi:hypothetical protein
VTVTVVGTVSVTVVVCVTVAVVVRVTVRGGVETVDDTVRAAGAGPKTGTRTVCPRTVVTVLRTVEAGGAGTVETPVVVMVATLAEVVWPEPRPAPRAAPSTRERRAPAAMRTPRELASSLTVSMGQ